MSRNQWLLVEWVDERNVFPCYGVVNVDSLVSDETDPHPGKMIFVRAKHGNSARRAQILRISDDKRHVKEHRLLLERQDHQVKNMLSMCMRTIKEMKTDPLIFRSFTSQQSINGAGGSGVAAPVDPDSDSSIDSDRGLQINEDIKPLPLNNSVVKTPAQYKRESPPVNGHSLHSTIQNASQKKRSMVSSTPLHQSNIVKEIPKLTFDQGTQTDDTQVHVPAAKIEQMETILNQLYRQFLTLVGRLQLDCPESSMYNSDGENRDREISDRENNTEEPITRDVGNRALNQPRVEPEDLRRNAKSLQVRRVSAQTTNTVEPAVPADKNDMVPIGIGHATVPARLLNEINWESYSSATRQLLQALFPRKVLATHSLTGKQSPAFTDKPPKKCLDPKLIDDIVDTVAERCGVPKRSVRNCITIKCTDEAKLYRNRMLGRSTGQMRTNQINQENVPPSPITSRESSNGTD